MIFYGQDNSTVEFKVMNYEFPNSTDKQEDGNWLVIYLKVDCQFGQWQAVHPSLLTWNIQELIDWFSDLSNNNSVKWTDQEFIEPNISFHLLNSYNADIKQIKIKFDLELRPKNANDEIEYFINFQADSMKLKEISNQLGEELKKFPERR